MVPHLGHTELIVVIVTAGVHVQALGKTQRKKREKRHCWICARIYLHGFSLGQLTFAGLDALRPPVTSVSVPGTSAVLVPSTARSATTDSTGFRERTALGTCHHTNDR